MIKTFQRHSTNTRNRNFVGTVTETLIRLLKELKEAGFIDTQTRKIFIIKKEELIQLAGGHR